MNIWLDIVGATIISGIIILVIITLNSNIGTSSKAIFSSNISQSIAAEAGKNIEHDFYKIGYRVAGEKISIADSNMIEYYADIDNDGSQDTVRYYLGTTADMDATANPDDMPVYRIQNNAATPDLSNIVTKFKLSYYDSLGNQLNYILLSSAAIREKIKIIQVYLKHSSVEPVDGSYPSVEWKKTIRPKNLN